MEQLAGQAVTVLGAGVAGLAAAIALAQRGAKVTVLEQADAIREFGAGLQITPNGAAVLRAAAGGDGLDGDGGGGLRDGGLRRAAMGWPGRERRRG